MLLLLLLPPLLPSPNITVQPLRRTVFCQLLGLAANSSTKKALGPCPTFFEVFFSFMLRKCHGGKTHYAA